MSAPDMRIRAQRLVRQLARDLDDGTAADLVDLLAVELAHAFSDGRDHAAGVPWCTACNALVGGLDQQQGRVCGCPSSQQRDGATVSDGADCNSRQRSACATAGCTRQEKT